MLVTVVITCARAAGGAWRWRSAIVPEYAGPSRKPVNPISAMPTASVPASGHNSAERPRTP